MYEEEMWRIDTVGALFWADANDVHAAQRVTAVVRHRMQFRIPFLIF